VPPPKRTCFTFLSHFLGAYIASLRGFHLGVSGLYTLCFNQITPLTYCLSTALLPNIQQLPGHYVGASSHTGASAHHFSLSND
jgi:hypothetical protein